MRSIPRALLLVLLLATASLAPGATPLRAQEPAPVVPAASVPADVAPAAVPDFVPLSNVKALAVGYRFACALTTAGGVKCWGHNANGQLGDNSTTNRLLPVNVVGLTSGVVAIDVGYFHACAVLSGGTVRCWGSNTYGGLGVGVFGGSHASPSAVPNLTGVTALALGGFHSCARLSNGSLRCWGHNAFGQLGDGTMTNRSAPVAVSGASSLPAVSAVVAGMSHTCAIAATGPLWCWGANGTGAVGDNTTTHRSLPVQVFTPAVKSAGAGGAHTCAVEPSGRTWCWGYNLLGQLGDGTTTGRGHGAYVLGLGADGSAASVHLGDEHSCARLPVGAVVCWGSNVDGQLGGNAPRSTVLGPVDVEGLPAGVVDVGGGYEFTCARTEGGQVYCWGYNRYGQLGDGTTFPHAEPKPVLVPATCYRLTRTKSGASGSTPVADPPASDGCPLDHFVAGAPIQITAAPSPGNKVRAWQNVPGGTPGVNVALLNMPAADTSINVLYGTCHALTLQVSGGTGPVRLSPANSLGCGSGKFGVSDRITLVAAPTATQRVKSWTGADVAPGTGMQVNTVTMPDAATGVLVTYEACLALSVSVSGGGDAPIVYPAQSEGCAAAGTYAAGETVTLVARPSPGYLVGGWSGTDGTTSFAAAQVTMPAESIAVGVTYAPASHTTYLPAVSSGE